MMLSYDILPIDDPSFADHHEEYLVSVAYSSARDLILGRMQLENGVINNTNSNLDNECLLVLNELFLSGDLTVKTAQALGDGSYAFDTSTRDSQEL
jgi:hypothetical protein